MATVGPVDEAIVVRGSGHERAMPDRAVVRATVEADGAGRQDAYGEAARLAGQVDGTLAHRLAAIDRISPGLSTGARDVLDKFDFASHIARLERSNLLCMVVSKFAQIDLTSRSWPAWRWAVRGAHPHVPSFPTRPDGRIRPATRLGTRHDHVHSGEGGVIPCSARRVAESTAGPPAPA